MVCIQISLGLVALSAFSSTVGKTAEVDSPDLRPQPDACGVCMTLVDATCSVNVVGEAPSDGQPRSAAHGDLLHQRRLCDINSSKSMVPHLFEGPELGNLIFFLFI